MLARFNKQGCFQTTIDHVLADVGIGKGTLYREYPTRDDLFKAALRAGLDTLRARCEHAWETHGPDPAARLRATIAELVSLNRRRDATSPATLARLRCGCHWMSHSDPGDGNVESVLVPVVQRCQAARVIDEAAGPSLVAAVIVALVNSAPIVECLGGEPRAEAAASRNPSGGSQTTDVADQVVALIQRAFPLMRDVVSVLAEA